MRLGMAADRAREGHDVVVEEDHHVVPGAPGPGVEGSQLPAPGDAEGDEARPRLGEPPEGLERGMIRAIDDHHHLERRGVGQDRVDQRGQALGAVDGGDHDRGARRTGGVLFLAWGAVSGRSRELAGAVGGEARCFYPVGTRRPGVLARWALSAVATVREVARLRPDVLVVTNPPSVAAAVGWAAGRLAGARVVLDSHPGAFGAQGDRVAARLQPVHRWVTRRADLSIVAAEPWRALVASWGARALVVHEAPGDWVLQAPQRSGRLRVLYVGRFAADEPWHEVLEAARRLPAVDVLVTGDPAGAGVEAGALPPNVSLVGYLDERRYREAVYGSDLVVSLTTEPASVMRAGCEAVWAGRPLVVSDWPVARDAFPFALHTGNSAAALVEALGRADAGYGALAGAVTAARRAQEARWEAQRDALVAGWGEPRRRARRGRGA